MAGRFNGGRAGLRKVKRKVERPKVSTNLNANANTHRWVGWDCGTSVTCDGLSVLELPMKIFPSVVLISEERHLVEPC